MALAAVGRGRAAAQSAAHAPRIPTRNRKKYEVIVVSPRNYFLYTPLLPAVCTGTMEERSIVEPVRNLVKDKVCMAGWVGALSCVWR